MAGAPDMAGESGGTWAEGINIYSPRNLQELFGFWSRFPGAVPWAGGTSLGRRRGSPSALWLPRSTISLEQIEELRRITRTERYLEAGAMVTLSGIIRLGKIVPNLLSRSLRSMASYQIRNLMTLGGLISSAAPQPEGVEIRPGTFRSPGSAAAFIALDARFELRAAENARWISAARFYTPGQGLEAPAKPRGIGALRRLPAPRGKAAGEAGEAGYGRELLTRVRIPLEQWNCSYIRRFRTGGSYGTAIFLARIEKNTIMELRVILAADRIVRSQSGESCLVGKSIPLERRYVSHFREIWKEALDESGRTDSMIRSVLLNCIESCALELGN